MSLLLSLPTEVQWEVWRRADGASLAAVVAAEPRLGPSVHASLGRRTFLRLPQDAPERSSLDELLSPCLSRELGWLGCFAGVERASVAASWRPWTSDLLEALTRQDAKALGRWRRILGRREMKEDLLDALATVRCWAALSRLARGGEWGERLTELWLDLPTATRVFLHNQPRPLDILRDARSQAFPRLEKLHYFIPVGRLYVGRPSEGVGFGKDVAVFDEELARPAPPPLKARPSRKRKL